MAVPRWALQLAVLLAVLLETAHSICPNSCSGHGICGASNICACFDGWKGGAADCSFRNCPLGAAWADKAYATDKAHLPAECSNAGRCNYMTGTCECFDGFTGSACQRSSCPNNCNGHGACMTIADISYWKGPDYDPEVQNAGDGKGVVYTNWDKNSILMCDCDAGFFGSDCSLIYCPKGDDPLTLNQNYRTITLTVYKTSGTYSGSLGFQFQGATTYLSLTSPTSANCISTLQTSPQIGLVGCTVTFPSALTIQYTITFYSWPTNVKSNNFHYHDGNPLLREFLCDVSMTSTDVSCEFGDVVNDNVVGAFLSPLFFSFAAASRRFSVAASIPLHTRPHSHTLPFPPPLLPHSLGRSSRVGLLLQPRPVRLFHRPLQLRRRVRRLGVQQRHIHALHPGRQRAAGLSDQRGGLRLRGRRAANQDRQGEGPRRDHFLQHGPKSDVQTPPHSPLPHNTMTHFLSHAVPRLGLLPHRGHRGQPARV